MGLKDTLKSMNKTKRTYVSGQIDMYLLGKQYEPNDRAINVNAPSQSSNCCRQNYYARMGYDTDSMIDARAQRIFDNGSDVHERLQGYLLDMNLLICDECPLINEEYNIQGHTDGILDLGDEIAILEIKSINDRGFSSLKDAKFSHKQQGLIYLYCLEERRKYLHAWYPTRDNFFESCNVEHRRRKAAEYYQHLKGGSKFSREEKIQHQVDLHTIVDDILIDTHKPVTKVVFLYENKNTQDLKEFVVERNEDTEPILEELLSKFYYLNECVEKKKLPDREGTSRSCETCRWCPYVNECWIV